MIKKFIYFSSILCFILFPASFFAQEMMGLESDCEWEMAPGFGNDENHNGRIDMPNTAVYAAKKNFDIDLRLSDGFFKRNAIPFSQANRIVLSLEMKREGRTYVALGKGRSITLSSVEVGDYSGYLTARYERKSFQIPLVLNPKRYVIAVLGDSYASGEGVPDLQYQRGKYSIWGDGGPGSPAILNHHRAHRSSRSWAAQMALFLEKEDPHSSIIFIFLAASGAWVTTGILEPYGGTDTSLGGEMPAQIDEVAEICQKEKIDYLFLSIGGNDVGFVPIVVHGIAFATPDEVEPDSSYIKIWDSIVDCAITGQWKNSPLAGVMGYKRAKPRPGLEGVHNAFKELDKQIKERLNVEKVVFVGYPLPMLEGESSLKDIARGFFISKYEASRIYNEVMLPLQKKTQEWAHDLGWKYVSMVDAYDYSKHSYESPLPYTPEDYGKYLEGFPLSWKDFKKNCIEKEISWFRTASSSVVIQGASMDGALPNVFNTRGTVHPNEFGFQAIMHQVLRNLELPKGFPSDFQKLYD